MNMQCTPPEVHGSLCNTLSTGRLSSPLSISAPNVTNRQKAHCLNPQLRESVSQVNKYWLSCTPHWSAQLSPFVLPIDSRDARFSIRVEIFLLILVRLYNMQIYHTYISLVRTNHVLSTFYISFIKARQHLVIIFRISFPIVCNTQKD